MHYIGSKYPMLSRFSATTYFGMLQVHNDIQFNLCTVGSKEILWLNKALLS